MEKNPTFLFVVAAAIIKNNGTILMQTRPQGKSMEGLWEFPGGKVENHETPENALVRELKEELDIEVFEKNLSPTSFASEALGSKHLILLLYKIEKWQGIISPREKQRYDWFEIDDLPSLEMPPADIPLVEMLRRILTK